MRKLVVALSLTLVFSLGVIAGETLEPDGWGWQKIARVRQMGYVEGFLDGEELGSRITTPAFEHLCEVEESTRTPPIRDCILRRLWGNTLAGTDEGKTLDTIVRFYASPQNLPVHWGHAVIISQAMVSGVALSEKDLEVVRKEDATPPKPMSEKELQDLLGRTPKK